MRVRKVIRRAAASVATATLAAGLALAVPTTASAEPGDPGAENTVQILGINDLHGRIENLKGQVAGAAVMAGAVDQLEADHPGNTVLVGAGDLIGASPLISNLQQDKPTIDALNAMGLDVSSVGNHEFDQGYEDIINRLQKPYDAEENPYGGADWTYLGANVKFKDSGEPALPPTWSTTLDNGVTVGFVGAVTLETPEAVDPEGIANIKFTDIAKAANAGADALVADGADVIIMLVHEGMEGQDCAAVTNPDNPLGAFYTRLSPKIDAVVTAHTHQKYDCMVEVPAWVDAGRAVTKRPVVQSGSYAKNLDQILFTVNSSGEVTAVDANVLPLSSKNSDGAWVPTYPVDPDVKKIVDDAIAYADAQTYPIGKIAAPLDRGKFASGAEDRGAESALGNMVAEAHRQAVAGADIGMINPGSLRIDLRGDAAVSGYPAMVTNAGTLGLLPFGNTLTSLDLTGAQLKQVLEQQWQPGASEENFLRLGLSDGFTYTYDPDAPQGEHITQMWLNGELIDPSATYTVAANGFLAHGGDSFDTFTKGTNVTDTGISAEMALEDYLKKVTADGTPLQPDYSQHSVGVNFPADAPAEYAAGDTVMFQLSSLGMSNDTATHDDSVTVSIGDQVLGTFAVENSVDNVADDATGTASVSFALPDGIDPGNVWLTIEGDNTGTVAKVGITVESVLAETGAPVGEYAAMALLLLLLGGGFLLIGRRRRAATQE